MGTSDAGVAILHSVSMIILVRIFAVEYEHKDNVGWNEDKMCSRVAELVETGMVCSNKWELQQNMVVHRQSSIL